MKRRKQHLISFEKSRRIIYLEPRGKEKKNTAITIFFAVLAVLCLLYCVSIGLFMGYGTKFFLVWGVIALVLAGMAIVSANPGFIRGIPKWIRYTVFICSAVGILTFLMVESMILAQFGAKAAPGADYMIVLGAQWKSTGPSYVLQKRLDCAVEYLLDNPDTQVVVSGGQGANEPITEAAGMRSYLEEKGIARNRIRVEEQSTNTYENLVYSSAYLDREKDTVVLVTNNFHVFRACQIAKKQGYVHIEGLAADSYPAMIPNNLLREFLGVIKDFAVGNL